MSAKELDQATRVRDATRADAENVLALLRRENLPTDGVAEHLENFLVAEEGESIVACAGMELYGDAALLRSVAVEPRYRRRGLGGELVGELIRRASRRGLRSVFLLTTTAEHYFAGRGFERVTRDSVDPALLASAEFRGACPSTAVCMRLHIAH
jgi:amino-acid N-acetyltransferase